MKTKEEILEQYKHNGRFDFEGKYDQEDIYVAMEEYSNEMAMAFGQWLSDNGYERIAGTYAWEGKFGVQDLDAIINSLSPKQFSLEQLYGLFLKSKNTINV